MSRKDISATMEVDLRLRRAQELATAVMAELDPVLSGTDRSGVYRALVETFHRSGACIETDALRSDLGKEPRDEMGWTPSERVRAEAQRRDALFTMQRYVVSFGESKEGQSDA